MTTTAARNYYPRETVEFQAVHVYVDTVEVTAGVDLAVLLQGHERPITEWAPAEELDGDLGYMIDGLEPGVYEVWARVVSLPEVPVIYLDRFTVT